jgi:hypothetical protein
MNMATAIFHPQAWVNDYAIEVDPEGDTAFEVGDVPDSVEDDSYESDNLRDHENAPQWVKDWSGPFYIEIVRPSL